MFSLQKYLVKYWHNNINIKEVQDKPNVLTWHSHMCVGMYMYQLYLNSQPKCYYFYDSMFSG